MTTWEIAQLVKYLTHNMGGLEFGYLAPMLKVQAGQGSPRVGEVFA